MIASVEVELEEFSIRRDRAERTRGVELTGELGLTLNLLGATFGVTGTGQRIAALRLQTVMEPRQERKWCEAKVQIITTCVLTADTPPADTLEQQQLIVRSLLLEIPRFAGMDNLRYMLNAMSSIGVGPGPEVAGWFESMCRVMAEKVAVTESRRL